MFSISNFWPPVTSEFWPTGTFLDLSGQTHVAYVVIWGHMSMHAKMTSLAFVLKFWPQWPQFTVFDLMWPLMTSDVKITYHILFPDVIWVYMPKIASLSILIKAWWNTEQMLQHTNNRFLFIFGKFFWSNFYMNTKGLVLFYLTTFSS